MIHNHDQAQAKPGHLFHSNGKHVTILFMTIIVNMIKIIITIMIVLRPNLDICFTQMGYLSPPFLWPSMSIWSWLSSPSSTKSWSWSNSGQTWTSVSLKWETFRLRPPSATHLCHAGDHKDSIIGFMIFTFGHQYTLDFDHISYISWSSQVGEPPDGLVKSLPRDEHCHKDEDPLGR